MTDIPIEHLSRTKPQTIARFKYLDIVTFSDLLNHFPTRYENFSLISALNRIQAGEKVTVQGIIQKAENVYTKRGFKIQKVLLKDDNGSIELIWYNQPYLIHTLGVGAKLSVAGEVKQSIQSFSMQPVEYEVIHNDLPTIHTGRLVPIYPETGGLSSRTIREKVWQVIEKQNALISEWLPDELLKNNFLIDENQAYNSVHFPKSLKEVESARKRLSFDEFFSIQLATHLIKKEWKKETVGHIFTSHGQSKIDHFVQSLPFQLTQAQRKAVQDILSDLMEKTPMNRFLQGDVGSGKTVVAAIASYFTHLNGYQSFYMAPTEILAQQHYETFKKLFQHLPVTIGLQTGSKKVIIKKKTPKSQYDIIIGTQALLHTQPEMSQIGLVIVDEQHRFGVAQRALLKQKGVNPHLLTMTATPIPRTVALTVYGELDMSVLDEMPTGRLPVKTYFVAPHKRQSAYEWIKKHITDGNQVFVICPLIEESEVETLKSIKAAKAEYENLKLIFSKSNVALLHGKMKPAEKEAIMNQFKTRTCQILVSTSVVEVGIDIPNATIMIIEGAERFGLAQLHQLRGRVGRSDKQSYCLLYSDAQDERSRRRLSFFSKTLSGLELAEYDLKIRGPGDLFGTRQHGYRDLKIASFSDLPLIEATRRAVNFFMNTYNLKDFPEVAKRIEKYKVHLITRD